MVPPSTSTSRKLIGASILKEVALDNDQHWQSYPWKFYGLTEEGRAFLAAHSLLAAEETLQQIYDTVSDKPEKMPKFENVPRLDDIWRCFLFSNSLLFINRTVEIPPR